MIRRGVPAILLALVLGGAFAADDRYVTLVGTTTIENSGLYGAILPKFTANTGIKVHLVSVGTGRAIRLAQNGDADVLLVHHRPSEDKFVAEGHGVKRFDVMYNDFIIVGPKADPAGIRGLKAPAAAFKRIAESNAVFVSRGDDSGTHRRELAVWTLAGVDPKPHSGRWYRVTGSGMGATLNVASAIGAYTLSDRGTWLKFKNKSALTMLFEGDPLLFNRYSVILVNPAMRPYVKAREGQALIDWLIGADGQRAIASYRIDGHQAFFPNAGQDGQ